MTSCSEKILVLHICSSPDPETNTNFKIRLNGSVIATYDLTSSSIVGDIYIGSLNTSLVISDPMFPCGKIGQYNFFSGSIPIDGLNTVNMDQTNSFMRGGATITASLFDIVNNVLVNRSIIGSMLVPAGPAPIFTFNLTCNATSTTPTPGISYPPVGPIPINPPIDHPTTRLPPDNIAILTTIPPNIQILNPRKILVSNITTVTTTINTTSDTTSIIPSTIKPLIIDCSGISWNGKLNF